MNRILEIPEHARSDEQARLVQKVTDARGMFFSPYKVWIYSPPVGFAMEMLGTYLNSDISTLSAAEMELAALVTARFWNASYVIKNHARHAARAGLESIIIDAVASGRDPEIADARLSAIHRFTSSSLYGKPHTDAEFQTYLNLLTRAGIADLLAVIGYFTAVSLAMKAHAIE